MYCSGCGHALNPSAQVCPACGRPNAATAHVAQPFVAPVPYVFSRVQRNLQTVGTLWLVYAGWTLLGWLFALPILARIFGHGHGPYWGPPNLPSFPQFGWILPFATALVVARAALSLVTGIALLRRASWGRTLALVTGFLTLIKPITGTLLAIYTLWVLLPAPSGQEYDRLALT